MSLESIASVISPKVQTATDAANGSIVSKDDFLKLLVAQMQQQDPLNPQDPTEFTAQLTQFSNLEQLMSVNENIEALGVLDNLNAQSGTANYLGQKASAFCNSLRLTGGTSSQIKYQLPRDSVETTLNIYDADNKLVDTVELGKQSAGTLTASWDGKDASGKVLADGTYTFKVVGEDAAGDEIATDTMVTGTITGVSFANGGTVLEIDGQRVPLIDLVAMGSAA